MARSFAEIVQANIASGVTRLPVFDATAVRLRELLADPDASIEAIVGAISMEPVLASAVLRLANSSFFGGLRQVVTLRDAVGRLGTEQVTRLALLVSQSGAYRVRAADLKPLVGSLWAHAVSCALGSQWLAERLGRRDLATEAFLGGMLHDIGKLLVLRVVDDLRRQHPKFRADAALVCELMRSMHTESGAALVRGWNIPDPYQRIVGHHHDPEIPAADTLLHLIRLVDKACNSLGLGVEPDRGDPAASEEAQALHVTDVMVAELEVQLEDSRAAASMATA